MPQRSNTSAPVLADRRRRVAALYLEGRSQYDIARSLKINQPTVSRDLAVVRDEWLKASVRDYNHRKAEELARIDHLEAEAWDAWHRSKKPAETRTAKGEPVTDPDTGRTREKPTELTRRREGRDGNPTFLSVVQYCIDKRCAILGLDAPKQFQLLGAVAVQVELPPPAGLTPADLAALADMADRCGLLGPAVPPARAE